MLFSFRMEHGISRIWFYALHETVFMKLKFWFCLKILCAAASDM